MTETEELVRLKKRVEELEEENRLNSRKLVRCTIAMREVATQLVREAGGEDGTDNIDPGQARDFAKRLNDARYAKASCPDADCPLCKGRACLKCDHDVLERHEQVRARKPTSPRDVLKFPAAALSASAKKAELFAVQYEVAPPDEGMPDGVWSPPDKLHADEMNAEAEIVEKRAGESFWDGEPGPYRIIKIVGEVVSISLPKEDNE